MTPFCFEHVFRAASRDEVFAAYFDPDLQREQDQAVDILERTILEDTERGDERRRVCRVVPRRQLPAIVRPLVAGELHYVETAHWRRADHQIEIEIRPSILKGKATIAARYQLFPDGDGRFRRRYEGRVSVDVALLAGRIERGIVAEFERSMPRTAACTQVWLDRSRSVPSRA